MTDATRNVELVIRAKNLSKKTLGDVQKEIESINAALEAQVEASKKGQGSMKELDKAYRDLETAMKALVQQQSVVTQFEKQEAALVALQVRLGEASVKLREHQAAMAASENVTKRQVTQLVSYQKAVTKTQDALDKQVERLAKTRAEGEQLGLTMNDLAGAQNAILATGRKLSDTYDLQSKSVDEFADNVERANRLTKQASDDALFEKQAAEAQRLLKASEYVNFWVTELEHKEAVERRMAADKAADKAFQDSAESAAKLNRASEYVNFWTNALNELDATQKRVAAATSLNEMADDAVAASRGYTTLAGSAKRLVQNNNLLAKSIAGILDPAAQARGTLSGVEEEINSLAASIAQIKGPVADYKAQVAQLIAANKQLSAQAAGIDAYAKQVQVLREARAEFVKNRAELTQYAATLRSADTPTAEMQANLKRLQGALAASAQGLQNQITATRTMREGLRQAGVATNDLAGAQARLLQSAKTSTTALQQLGVAADKYGTSVETAGRKQALFSEGGRTTLSLMQRIRGEVLALAAAYVGLQGTIGLANDAIDASNTKQGIQNQLALSVGDAAQEIAAEYQYIREQADRIGISFEEAARGYAKFSAAASLAGRGRQEIRFVAESFLEVGRVANLSADNIDGVFKALEQIYSKGKIQAEELRGQLGDRLFGAFEIAARALNDQFPDLDKAMKDGLITSSQLLAIAEEYRRTVATRLPTAMESLAANQQRLNSAFFDFKVLIADSGFADEYGRLVASLNKFLNSDDGARFAKNLSAAFGTIVNVLTWMLEHLDEIQIAVELAFGLKAMSLVAGLAAAVSSQLIPALRALIPMLAASGVAGVTAFGKIRTAFALLAAAFVGWKIGELASEKFEIVRQLGISLVIGLIKAFKQLEFSAKEVWVNISTSWKDVAAVLFNAITKMFRDTLGLLEKAARAAGATDIADRVGAAISFITLKGSDDAQKQVAELRSQLQKELAQVDQIGFDMFQAASDAARAAEATAKTTANIAATEKPEITISTAPGDGKAAEKAQKAYEKLVKQRIALADQLVRALETAEAKIQRNEKMSLEQRLAAIDTEYAKVFRKIDQLTSLPGGAAQAKQMRETLAGYIEQIKKQETLKFNQEEMARKEKAINDLLSLRSQLLQNIANQQKTGQLTTPEAKAATADVNQDLNPKITGAVEAARQFALANQSAFTDQVAMDTYLAKLQAIDNELTNTTTGLLSLEQVNNDIAAGLTGSFDAFAAAIARGEDAVGAFKQAFLQFVADFLKKIALMIIQQIILNALAASNPYGAIASAAIGAVNSGTSTSQHHSGGVVGSGGTKVRADASWFVGAPKYHNGGMPGLASDEYTAILKRNEEVLTENDPRNVLNGGVDSGSGNSTPALQDLTVNNYVDAESFMSAALAKPSGQKMIMNVLSANRSQVKSLVGG